MMADTPELDQVADARRKLAAHAGYPTAYWVLFAVALVAIVGLPIWMSYLPEGVGWFQWGLVAVCWASVAYAVLRRRSSGVYLPKRVTSYPGARMTWLAVLAFTVVGYFGIDWLVDHDRRGIALAALVPFAAVVLLGQLRIQSSMRRDIEAGRVTP